MPTTEDAAVGNRTCIDANFVGGETPQARGVAGVEGTRKHYVMQIAPPTVT